MSKLLEKLLINRSRPSIEHELLIPEHQFVFREEDTTTKRIYSHVN